MKKNMLLVVLLIAAMILAMFAGCGAEPQAQSAAQDAPEAEMQQEAASETTTAEAAEAETQQTPVEPDSAAEPEELPEEEPVSVRESIQYPLCEPGEVEFSLFTSAGGMGGTSVETLDIYQSFQQAEKATGIKMTYNLAAPEATETKLNLIVASGDFPTFFTGLDMYYVSGRSAAIEDGVVTDLAPYLDECAPDYMNFVDENPGMKKLISTDEGEIPFVAPKAAASYSGLSIRKDWLDDLGLEVPETYDELTDVLDAFKKAYGCSDAMLLSSKFCGEHDTLCAGYNMNMLRGNIGSLAFEVIDGKVELFCQSDGFVDYMKMLAGWKANGYITHYLEIGPFNVSNYVADDSCGVWVGGNNYFSDDWAPAYYSGSYDFKAIPMADVTKTPGEAVELGGLEVSIDGEHAWSVTTACDDVEMALNWLNWWYTDEGCLAANFGNEGEHYTMVDGTPIFTDLILHDPSGYGVFFATAIQLGASTPASQHPARLDPRNTLENEVQQSCKDIWFPESRGTAYTYYGDMTAAESELYAARAGDIGTYVEEYMGKVIDGTTDVEETYDEMIENCFAMGLQDVLDVKQAAYDRYLNR